MSVGFEISQGAERPSVVFPFTSAGTALDLTAYSAVTLKVRDKDGTAVLVSDAGTVLSPHTGGSAAYLGTALAGLAVGDYRAWFVVSFPSGPAGDLEGPEFPVRVVDHSPDRGVPGARPTMAYLIRRVRSLTNDVPGASQVFDDAEVQEHLDDTRIDFRRETLAAWPDQDAGTVAYFEYRSEHRWLEQTQGGTARFVLEDSLGGTASAHEVDYSRGIVTFGASQAGSAFYLTARSYDPYGAAASLLEAWASKVSLDFDFQTDGQRFDRSQKAAMLRQAAGEMRRRSRARTATLLRGDACG